MDYLSEDTFNSRFRLVVLGLLILAGLFIVFARVVVLAGFSGSYYRELSSGNRTRQTEIPANRGIIFDRYDKPLVANLPVFVRQKCSSGKCDREIITKEEALLDSNSEAIAARHYLYGPVLAHVLGYVSLADRVGVGGVEEIYNRELAGTPGKELFEVDATGKKLRSLGKLDQISGEDLHLTIDLNLQQALYEGLKGVSGAAVVTIPATGEVLALVSAPPYDPNLFTVLSADQENREKDIENVLHNPAQPIFDRAIGGTFPPGSTFKVITASAGMESGAITAATRIEDTGILVIGPFKFANWKWLRGGGTEGVLDLVGAIRRSNDIFFYKVGEMTGLDKIVDMAKRFGLGAKLGIDLPGEATGLVPDKAWREKYAREWYLGDTYHLAIGQGDLLVTPLQVNAWTAAMANGGKVCRPHVLAGPNDCRDLGLKKETVDLIKKGMGEACSPGGTGWPLFNYRVKTAEGKEIVVSFSCKTGTAEFGDPKDRTHAWFTAFSQGAVSSTKPQIAITLLIEGGGEGSDVAGPVVKKVLDKWYSRD